MRMRDKKVFSSTSLMSWPGVMCFMALGVCVEKFNSFGENFDKRPKKIG
jgi:hypothetical protein